MLYFHDFIKIILACFLGGLIGQQRQKKGMSIGLRTHIVVCVSSALVQITSIDYNLLNNSNSDVMRLGAQVISGIGFLGMASIIKEGKSVVGLTTAASMWFIACVGLAIGSGLYFQSILVTLIIYIILIDLFKFDKRIHKYKTKESFDIQIIINGKGPNNSNIKNVLNKIQSKNLDILNTEINKEDECNIIISMAIMPLKTGTNDELILELTEYDYVRKVNIA